MLSTFRKAIGTTTSGNDLNAGGKRTRDMSNNKKVGSQIDETSLCESSASSLVLKMKSPLKDREDKRSSVGSLDPSTLPLSSLPPPPLVSSFNDSSTTRTSFHSSLGSFLAAVEESTPDYQRSPPGRLRHSGELTHRLRVRRIESKSEPGEDFLTANASPNPAPRKRLTIGSPTPPDTKIQDPPHTDHEATRAAVYASRFLNTKEFFSLRTSKHTSRQHIMSPHFAPPVASSSATLLVPYKKEDEGLATVFGGIKKNSNATLLLLNQSGDLLGFIADSLPTKRGNKTRTLYDPQGRVCAVLIRGSPKGNGQRSKFKICGTTAPPTPPQERTQSSSSDHSGLYTWATVKNSSSGLGNAKFTMNLTHGDEDEFVTSFVAESFGTFSLGAPRGFLIRQKGLAASSSPSNCGRITYLGGSRGMVIEPTMDPCLMTCFAAIVEEMVEQRLR